MTWDYIGPVSDTNHDQFTPVDPGVVSGQTQEESTD